MNNIELESVGLDYIEISYTDIEGELQIEAIYGIAVEVVMTLGKALHKKSFLRAEWNKDLENWVINKYLHI